MEAEFGIRTLDQLPLAGSEQGDTIFEVIGGGPCQVQITLKMPCFRAQQRPIEARQLVIQIGCDGGKPLAGTGLYEGAHHQGVHQAAGLFAPNQLVQGAGVAPGGQVPVSNAARLHQRQHLLEMP